MIMLTWDEMEDVQERCHYARWGYDGLGSIGPIEPYKRRTLPMMAHRISLESAIHHTKGNGWKANHKS